jgi:hypothetical protein
VIDDNRLPEKAVERHTHHAVKPRGSATPPFVVPCVTQPLPPPGACLALKTFRYGRLRGCHIFGFWSLRHMKNSAKFAYRVTFDETSSDEGDFAFLQPDGYSRDQTRGVMKVASYACPPPNCLNTTLFISLLLYRGRALFHYIFFKKKT